MHRDDLLLLPPEDLLKHCTQQWYRGSGPGGQKRNKTATGVRLKYIPFNVEILCSDDRSAHVNKICALEKLRLAIALTQRREPPLAPMDFPGQKGRVALNNKLFAPWVAQMLDYLQAQQGQIKPVAEIWQLSSSALVRIIYQDKALWQTVQKIRATAQLAPLQAP